MYKPIYEFLVWDNCKNNCKFCFQRKNPRLYDTKTKQIILNKVIEFIDSQNFKNNSHILICGGEIFDTPQIFNILNIFFKQIINRLISNRIDLIYINTNLIYQNLDGLYFFLNLIKQNNLFTRLKFTTSYDLIGRFKNKQSENLMLSNLVQIKHDFPLCNIVTNIILTNKVCESILNNSLNINNFMQKYNCLVNLIPYIILDQNLGPSRELVIKALNKIRYQNQQFFDNYISNISIDQSKLLYMYKNNKFQFCSCTIDKCGHSINFKRYSKNNTCFCCDLKEIFHA